MPADLSIRFQAQVAKVQTLIDGGLRLTLDLGQVEPAVIVALIDARQPGVMLECAAVVIKTEKQKETINAIREGTKRKSEWKAAEVQSTDSNS